MPRYRARQNYASWKLIVVKGETVELDEETAAWVERDAPGTLVAVEAGRRQRRKPGKNRMMTSPGGDRKSD